VQVASAIQVVLRNAVTAYYRLVLRPSDDFDRNIIYKMVWDRRPILKVFNEKVTCLKYVRSIVPNVAFAHRYYETTDLEAIDWNILPRNFVIKASHGSGGVIVVHEKAPLGNRLPSNFRSFGWRRFEVHPDNFDSALVQKIFSHLLKRTYGQGLNRSGPEWAYWNNNPHIIVEDFLSFNGDLPVRISCNVVHRKVTLFYWDQMKFPKIGEVALIGTSTFVPPFSIAEISKDLDLTEKVIENLLVMTLKIAGDIDYLRVDWFLSDDGIYFNELTNYCGGGVLKGKSYYQHLSEMWRPDRSDYSFSPGGGVTR
jgi:hypothetical protein